jgi:uncharacterized protein (DUF362 family)/Pyruvate/2-oxoacid:ferredoxin oxidoreductase delta subunit
MPENIRTLVTLSRCTRYHPDSVRQSIVELLEPLGGLSFFVKPNAKVLIKPNLLAAAPPEEAVTTHPLVIRVLAEMAREAGAQVLIGDSPAGSCSWEQLFETTGMREAAEGSGASLVKFDAANEVRIPGWKRGACLPLAQVLSEVDLVINAAKLKTHTLTGLSAAVKNTYGCVVGNSKGRLHREHPTPLGFSNILLDVYLAVKPGLSILDAVVAMEGTGPRNGRPHQAGMLMASTDANALDCVAAAITGFAPDQVTTLALARRRGLPGTSLSQIKTAGLTLEEAALKGFDLGAVSGGRIGVLLARFPGSWLRNFQQRRRPYPGINPQKCNGCAICYQHCPPQIISLRDKRAEIDRSRCIRCYCCQELCPQGAVEIFPR